jgi:hypothetical protein
MTEEKKSKNPFINMANEAKKANNGLHPGLGKAPKKQGPKANTKGFGGASVVRRSGRGG